MDAKKKSGNVKLTNKAGENKFNKGKNFSGPRKQGGKQGAKQGGRQGGKHGKKK